MISMDSTSTRRVAGALVAVIGVTIIVLTFTNRLFSRAPEFEALVDDFRPLFTPESVGSLRADLAGLDGAAAEFDSTVVPAVAEATGDEPDEVVALFEDQFPDVTAGMAAVPGLTAQFGGLADLVDAERNNFEAADAIPTESLTAASIPWILLAVGVATASAGVLLVTFPTRSVSLGAGLLGVVILIALVALRLPSKAPDADALNDAVAPLFDPATVTAANDGLDTVGAMAVQLQDEAMPALGEMLEVPPDKLDATVADEFPATATALAGLPESSARFSDLVALIEDNRPRYDNIKPVDFSQTINLTLGGAALSAILGIGVAFLGGRSTSTSTEQE